MTLCSGCYNTFLYAESILATDSSLREKINNNLRGIGYQYSPRLTILHFARFIYEKIGITQLRSQIVDSWKGLPVAVHNGCHFIRPSHIIGFDDPENPTKLEELVRVLGVEVIDYPQKMLCCGFPIQGVDAELSLKMAYKKLAIMKEYGAKAVIVVCPSCYLQFDAGQQAIKQKFDVSLDLPVFYLSELIGMSLGLNASSLGLSLHRVDTLSIIREIFPEQGSGD